MVAKNDQYLAGYQGSMAKADISSPQVRMLWLSVADSYRVLMDLEQNFPERQESRWPMNRGHVDGGQRRRHG